jgi:hypothetical protein
VADEDEAGVLVRQSNVPGPAAINGRDLDTATPETRGRDQVYLIHNSSVPNCSARFEESDAHLAELLNVEINCSCPAA